MDFLNLEPFYSCSDLNILGNHGFENQQVFAITKIIGTFVRYKRENNKKYED